MNPVRSTLIVFVTLLIFIGTAFLMFTRLPEDQFVLSEDGLMSVEAVTGSDVRIEIQQAGVGQDGNAFVVGEVYFVTPSEVRLSQVATIRIRYTEEIEKEFDLSGLSIAYFDLNVNAWRAVPTSLDRDRQIFSAETGHLSSWALVRVNEIVLPDEVNNAVNKLRDLPPSGSTGYLMEVAYSVDGEEFILHEERVASGGCNGVYQVGEHQAITEQDFIAMTKVDGVNQEMFFKVIATWEIGDGCPTSSLLGPSVNR